MFGMGFTEILFIAVIAILFLGPDKLPTAMVEIAKFFRTAKKTIGSVKDSLEEEMNVKEIKEEALAYKKQLLDTKDSLNPVSSLANLSDDILGDSLLDYDEDEDEVVKPKKVKKTPKAEKVTFEKKSKKEKKTKKEDVDV